MTNSISGLFNFFNKQQNGIYAADRNGNNAITKEELKSYLKDNGQSTEALDQFWNTFNTKVKGSQGNINNNTNLTDDEIKVYEIIQDYVNGLDQKATDGGMLGNIKEAWRMAVMLRVCNSSFIKSLNIKNLTPEIVNQKAKSIELECAGDCYKKYYKEALLKVNNYSEDATLDRIVSNYIDTVKNDVTSEQSFKAIGEKINAIIYSYGKTADVTAPGNSIDTNDMTILREFGYDISGDNPYTLPLNELQIAVLKNQILGNIKLQDIIPEGHQEYESFYRAALDDYTNTILEGKTFADFATLKTGLNADNFRTSDQFISATGKVEASIRLGILSNDGGVTFSFKNGKLPDRLLAKLKQELGDAFGELLNRHADNLRVFTNEILPGIIAEAGKVSSGALNNLFYANGVLNEDRLIEEIVNKSIDVMEKFLENGFDSKKSSVINDITDNLQDKWVDRANDDETKLAREKKVAIMYCRTISTLNSKFAQFVQQYFGSYETTINGMEDFATLRQTLNDLQAFIRAFGDPSEFTLDASTWSAFGVTEGGDYLSICKNQAKLFINQALDSFPADSKNTQVKTCRQGFINEIKTQLGIDDISKFAEKIESFTDENELDTKMKAISSKYQSYVSSLNAAAKEACTASKDIKWEKPADGDYSGSIAIIPSQTKEVELNPIVKDADGNTIDLALHDVTFSSSNPSVVSVDSDTGIATVKSNAEGTYNIVVSVIVDGVTVGRLNLTVKVGTIDVKDIENMINFDSNIYDKSSDDIIQSWDNDSYDDALDDARNDAKSRLRQDDKIKDNVKAQIETILKQYGKTISDIHFEEIYYRTIQMLDGDDIPLHDTDSRHHGFLDMHVQYSSSVKYSTAVSSLYKKLKPAYAKAIAEVINKRPADTSKADVLANTVDNIRNNRLSSIISGYSDIHTEFGIYGGEIVFQDSGTDAVFKALKEQVKTEFESTEEGKAALQALGGDTAVDKLCQAAWIAAYNDFNSSQRNSSATFVSKVLDNIKVLLNKMKTNPNIFEALALHTSYADTTLTDNLVHYNTNTTVGNDQIIDYSGAVHIDDDGTVHIANSTDDPDYQATMSALLSRLIAKYDGLVDSATITNVFHNAQKKALDICHSNTPDCPYGTGNNGGFVEDINRDWSGNDSRSGDDGEIYMKELVQITLYCFDKLLYAELMK